MLRDPAWRFDPEGVELSDRVHAVGFDLGFDPGDYDFLEENFVRTGTWWILAFARTPGRTVFGLRLLPGVPLARCPVVRVAEQSSEVHTVASSASCFVPIYLSDQLYYSDHWDKALRLKRSDWSALSALHRRLGGADDLEQLRRLVAAGPLPKQDARDYRRAKRQNASRAAELERDPGAQAFHRFRDTEEDFLPSPATAVGCFASALATITFLTHRTPETAWAMLQHPPGLDTALFKFHPWESCIYAAAENARAAAVAAARASTWKRDPLWPAVAALAASKAYDGKAHLAAAKHLPSARAFTALMAAAFWSAQRESESDPAALDAALALAKRERWGAIKRQLAAVAANRPQATTTKRNQAVIATLAAAMVKQGPAKIAKSPKKPKPRAKK